MTISVVSFIGQVVSEYVITENDYVDKIASWVDVNHEGSIPTWYATITLMACSVMLAVIAVATRVRARPYPLQWTLLSIGFALLSLEEILGVHSQATKVLRSVVSITEGPGYVLAMLAIGLVGLGILAVLFGRFYIDLPSRWRRWFTIGLVIYLLGVFASDAVGDYLITAIGRADLRVPRRPGDRGGARDGRGADLHRAVAGVHRSISSVRSRSWSETPMKRRPR